MTQKTGTKDTGMTDAEFAEAVNREMNGRLRILMIVIYDHPTDFPDCYVARVHFIGSGKHWPSPRIYIARNTLDEVRCAIPNWLRNLGRSPVDDPCIVEAYV